MPFTLELDRSGIVLMERFIAAEPHWKLFMEGLAHTMGSDAREHIKPFVKAKSVWAGSTHGTGAMAASIHEDVSMIGNGFAVTFDGNFYGNYLDVGSPGGPNAVWSRKNGLSWPIGKRGNPDSITMSKTFHGVGHFNPEWPVQFSVKTAKWLATESNMTRYSDGFMGRFLRELVR